MVNAVGLLQILLSCMCWRTAELMFYTACTCQSTVVDLFTREWKIISRFRHIWSAQRQKQRTWGWKCEFTGDTKPTEAGTSNNMKHSKYHYQFPELHLIRGIIHIEKMLLHNALQRHCLCRYIMSVLDSKATYFTVQKCIQCNVSPQCYANTSSKCWTRTLRITCFIRC